MAVGLQDRPSAAPNDGFWKSDYKIIKKPSFTDANSAIASLIFAYAGTPAFFNIAAEMRDPVHYTKALIICQTILSVIYITVGIVVYYFCGSYVSSPALGSAGPLLKKICYGIALPGLLVALILMLHVHDPSPQSFGLQVANISVVCEQVCVSPNPQRLETSDGQ